MDLLAWLEGNYSKVFSTRLDLHVSEKKIGPQFCHDILKYRVICKISVSYWQSISGKKIYLTYTCMYTYYRMVHLSSSI